MFFNLFLTAHEVYKTAISTGKECHYVFVSFRCAGVCLGMQLAVVEFARNVLNWKDAHSTEFNPDTTHPVVIEMPEHNPGQMGATMRLGKRKTVFKSKDSLLSKSVRSSFMFMSLASATASDSVLTLLYGKVWLLLCLICWLLLKFVVYVLRKVVQHNFR